MSDTARISALYRYPLKSARGEALATATLSVTGFEGDRQWLLVPPAGRFIPQREAPRLALLQAEIEAAALRLAAPGLAELRFAHDESALARRVEIWGDVCAAFDAGDETARALSTWLGRECRLVRFDPAQRRVCNPAWTGSQQAVTAFADAYPLLLIGTTSLVDLNRRLGRELPINRFRPNLVVECLEPYAEDRIDELRCGDVVLRAVKPCDRCVITTTDQGRGERDGDEPLRTLKTYRYDAKLRGVTFGQNLIIVAGQGGTLRVGEALQLRWRT